MTHIKITSDHVSTDFPGTVSLAWLFEEVNSLGKVFREANIFRDDVRVSFQTSDVTGKVTITAEGEVE